ncbi:hypothetical protein [Streptomyces eurocidicus]|uniref:Uncharacterized protein n=1 Tax=Streptomyces eurocidicus TaxID=66423 RepID=A0A7W8B977_STREU|nr:hypothetical protein [Streptomyces eurocidicus]MBB5118673.1 hypothetical protein [Streptomyces eurocidicus]MBF6056253.1 hypothetical protein [Streptomyces eurocidicus]
MAAWCGRLLLFAALLLGIVTMHTLGHPASGAGAEAGGMHGAAAEAGPGGGPHTTTGRHPAPAADRPGDHAGTFGAGFGAEPARPVGGAASLYAPSTGRSGPPPPVSAAAAHPAAPVTTLPAVPPVALARPTVPGHHSAVPGDRPDRTTDAAARMDEQAGQAAAVAKLSAVAEGRGPGRSAGNGKVVRTGEQSARTHGGAHASDPAHHTGMDPMSVCLAVLGAALLTLLLTTAALRRRRTVLPVTARALLRALWPVPPPPRHKALARLSVLRV